MTHQEATLHPNYTHTHAMTPPLSHSFIHIFFLNTLGESWKEPDLKVRFDLQLNMHTHTHTHTHTHMSLRSDAPHLLDALYTVLMSRCHRYA